MMKTLKDSSEIHEAARLFHELSKPASLSPVLQLAPDDEGDASFGATPSHWLRMSTIIGDDSYVAGKKPKGKKLEENLVAMCERGKFIGAVVAEESRLPCAVFHSPLSHLAVAGLFKVLSETLPQAMALLKESGTTCVSTRLSESDKAVARRFTVNDVPFYLMVFCPKETDERIEVESSISNIISILAHEALASQ